MKTDNISNGPSSKPFVREIEQMEFSLFLFIFLFLNVYIFTLATDIIWYDIGGCFFPVVLIME